MRPMEMAIRKKYAGRNDKKTQTKMNEEIMKLYQENNFNPASGCLPALLQLPIMLALYQVIINPLTYIVKIPADVIAKIQEAVVAFMADSTKATMVMQNDMIRTIAENQESFSGLFSEIGNTVSLETVVNLYHEFDFLSLNLLTKPTVALNWFLIVPVLSFITSFISSKVIRKLTYQPTANADGTPVAGTAMMDWMMPLMSVYIAFIVPSIIGIYWVFQNILSMLQQFILFKLYPIPKVTEEQLREAELALKGKSEKPKKAQPPMYDDEDDAPIIPKAPLQKKKQDARLMVSKRQKGISRKHAEKFRAAGKMPKAKKKP